jgi:hypothetical protein
VRAESGAADHMHLVNGQVQLSANPTAARGTFLGARSGCRSEAATTDVDSPSTLGVINDMASGEFYNLHCG